MSDSFYHLTFLLYILINRISNNSEGRYRGPWSVDEKTGECKGNPAEASGVQDLMRSLRRNKDISNRKHAKAISIDNMKTAYANSLKVLGHNFDRHRTLREHKNDPQMRTEWVNCIKAMFMLVFSIMAFTLWTR